VNSRTSAQSRSRLSGSPPRRARSVALGALTNLPGTDVLLVLAAALLALSVFELAAWLAAAPLAALVFSVAFVPLALFVTAVVSERQS
jgi:hypothetical protein